MIDNNFKKSKNILLAKTKQYSEIQPSSILRSGDSKSNITKTSIYTKYTFLPLNLYIQFSKYQNIFFLSVLILLIIPSVSPFTPYTYLAALFIVIGASMIKDAIEDSERHTDDAKINNRPIKTLMLKNIDNYTDNIDNYNTENQLTYTDNIDIIEKKTMNIEEYDIILLEKDEESPADGLFLVSFSYPLIMKGSKARNSSVKSFKDAYYDNVLYKRFRNICKLFVYVETSKIDGESSLKKKYSNISDVKNNIGNVKKKLDTCKCNIWAENDGQENGDKNIEIPICAYRMLENLNYTDPKDIDMDENTSDDSTTHNSEDNRYYIYSNKEYMNIKKQNIILRGTVLKGDFSIILVLKVEQRYPSLPFSTLTKSSTFSKRMEQFVLFVFAIFVIILIFSSIFSAHFLKKPYLYLEDDIRGSTGVSFLLANYIILSYIVPLSMCVMIEIGRLFFQSYIENMLLYVYKLEGNFERGFYDFFRFQRNTEDKVTLRNTEVIEQLGNVNTIICDKTGTLTQNKMAYKCGFINNFKNSDVNNLLESNGSNINKYIKTKMFVDEFINKDKRKEYKLDNHDLTNLEYYISNHSNKTLNGHINTNNVMLYMYILCLTSCNSVYYDNDRMDGTSQDEVAILHYLNSLYYVNIIFKDDNYLELKINGIFFKVEIGPTQEFESKLRRMSILAKISDITNCDKKMQAKQFKIIKRAFLNRYIIFTKGNRDSVNSNHLPIQPKNYDHLRELHLGYRMIDAIIAKKIITNSNTANIDESDKKYVLDNMTKEIHNFLGITLIEDHLQKDIKPTLSLFDNIYVITGDKRSTAMACVEAIGLNITWAKTYDDLILEDLEQEKPRKASIDYYNDIFIEGNKYHTDNKSCKIIYNTLPIQKKKIVETIQKQQRNDCIVVGDGFNDTAMIREASIGIGIYGREGSAAANVSDIKTTSFRSIIPIVKISRNAYIGFSIIVINSIAKNLLMIVPQVFYYFYGSNQLYNGEFLSWFNLLFTSGVVATESCFSENLLFKTNNIYDTFDTHSITNNINNTNNNENDRFLPFLNEDNIIKSKCIDPLIPYENVHIFFTVKMFIFAICYILIKGTIFFYIPYIITDKFKFFTIQQLQTFYSYVIFLSVVMTQLGLVTNINPFFIFSIILMLGTFVLIIRGFDVLAQYAFEIISMLILSIAMDLLAYYFRIKFLEN